MMKNNILKINILTIFLIISIAFICNAKNIGGEEIWLEWTRQELRNMSYGAVANTNFEDNSLNIEGYGRYQFKASENLKDFLAYLDENRFKKYIDETETEKLNDMKYGLQLEFSDYYNNNKEAVIEKEDEYLYEKYYKPIKNKVDINDDSRLKGAVLCYTVIKKNNKEDFSTISDELLTLKNNDNDIYIRNIFNKLYNDYKSDPIKEKRYKSLKELCIDNVESEYNSNLGELIITEGVSENIYSIKELNDESNYFEEFLTNYKFYGENANEWWENVRNNVSYKDEFSIDTGSLDFKTTTSHGIELNNYAEIVKEDLLYKKLDNGIYYIPQNTVASYSNIRFGINNIGQAGGSLACLSMAINKIKNIADKDELIKPDDLIEKIKSIHNGNYNYYYDKERKGMKNEIIIDVAKEYDINADVFSADSVVRALQNGHLVIARVSNSEFAEKGQFILLTGVTNKDGINYINLIDPNIYHANLMYKLFDSNYLKNECNGIFFELY